MKNSNNNPKFIFDLRGLLNDYSPFFFFRRIARGFSALIHNDLLKIWITSPPKSLKNAWENQPQPKQTENRWEWMWMWPPSTPVKTKHTHHPYAMHHPCCLLPVRDTRFVTNLFNLCLPHRKILHTHYSRSLSLRFASPAHHAMEEDGLNQLLSTLCSGAGLVWLTTLSLYT